MTVAVSARAARGRCSSMAGKWARRFCTVPFIFSVDGIDNGSPVTEVMRVRSVDLPQPQWV